MASSQALKGRQTEVQRPVRTQILSPTLPEVPPPANFRSTAGAMHMTNELTQDGSFNIGIQNVTNSPINVTQVLGKSLEYKDLLNQLQTQQKLFSRTPENETQERLEISQTIAQLEAIIEQFKKDVTQLAAEFDRIEINTDRLRRAKEHFEKGEIAAARAVFDSEREQMQDENDRLVKEKERYEKDVQPKLQHSSDEYYLSALMERAAYDNPNWLEATCDYFQRSINAFATEANIFQYAHFLQNHNRFDQAESFYQKCLDEFVNGDESKRATTLNNLAVLHSDKNELATAEPEYIEALAIRRKLAAVNPASYLPNVATTLNNLAILHNAKNELASAESEYAEALEIRRKLASVNPASYLPHVAMTLNNLAILHRAKNELAMAESEYAEALQIRRKLAAVNPASYLPHVAKTLISIAIYHFYSVPDRDRSINYLLEAVRILSPIAEAVPYTQRYLQTALTVLQQDWRLSEEEIQQMLTEK